MDTAEEYIKRILKVLVYIEEHIDTDAYSSFNLQMKEATDELINDSKFLFCID